jgi:hypothetical protein
MLESRYLMSIHQNDRTDDSRDERDASRQSMRGWWEQLSLAGKVLIPTTAAVLVFVTANALPPFVF